MFKLNRNLFFFFVTATVLFIGHVSRASIETIETDYEARAWLCHSMGPDNPNVSVRVWYDMDPGEDSFKIQIEQACNRSIYPIATVQDAKVSVRQSEFIYSGTSVYSGQSDRSSRIELHIQTSPRRTTLDLSSSLKIETIRSVRGDVPWAGAIIPLLCSQARLSSGDELR